jgi:hypothetical protein
VINHHLLGIHHVNETVPQDQWIVWDLGFLAWGALMLALGWFLYAAGRAVTARAARGERRRRPEQSRPGGRRQGDPPLPRAAG